jgi:hypothetical protein
MDYYSNWYNSKSPAYGMKDADWGTKQAENCWAQLKNDPSGIVWFDVENGGSSYSTPLTDPTTKSHAINIMRAFLTRMDQLNGKTNGIYCSVGWISWFPSEFRDRPLWVAWYNELVDQGDVIYACRKNGWVGDILIWQYASDGDVDDNGTADGQTHFHAEERFMDLNGWLGTQAQFNLLFSITTPDDETPPVIPSTYKTYKVTATLGLTIRELPGLAGKYLGGYAFAAPINITGIVKGDSTQKLGWGKINGQLGYVSMDWVKAV